MVTPVYVLVKTHSVTKMVWPLTRIWGAPPFAYLVPGFEHPLLGWMAAILGHSPNEDALYVGLEGLVLAIVGFVACRKRSKSVGPIAWTAAFAYVLSLGPRLYLGVFGGWAKYPFSVPNVTILHVNLHRLAKFGVWLPGALLAVMPITDGIRQPDRFGVVVLMCVAALAALGFDVVADKVSPRGRWAVGALFLALLAFALFEFASTSIYSDVSPLPVDKFMAQQKGSGAVMWLPDIGAADDEQIYKTVITGKPIAFGSSTFPPPQILELRTLMQGFPDPASVAALDRAGVRWIVWQRDRGATPVMPGSYRLIARFPQVDVLERVKTP
jgi:hypothetical protein